MEYLRYTTTQNNNRATTFSALSLPLPLAPLLPLPLSFSLFFTDSVVKKTIMMMLMTKCHCLYDFFARHRSFVSRRLAHTFTPTLQRRCFGLAPGGCLTYLSSTMKLMERLKHFFSCEVAVLQRLHFSMKNSIRSVRDGETRR